MELIGYNDQLLRQDRIEASRRAELRVDCGLWIVAVYVKTNSEKNCRCQRMTFRTGIRIKIQCQVVLTRQIH